MTKHLVECVVLTRYNNWTSDGGTDMGGSVCLFTVDPEQLLKCKRGCFGITPAVAEGGSVNGRTSAAIKAVKDACGLSDNQTPPPSLFERLK